MAFLRSETRENGSSSTGSTTCQKKGFSAGRAIPLHPRPGRGRQGSRRAVGETADAQQMEQTGRPAAPGRRRGAFWGRGVRNSYADAWGRRRTHSQRQAAMPNAFATLSGNRLQGNARPTAVANRSRQIRSAWRGPLRTCAISKNAALLPRRAAGIDARRSRPVLGAG